MHGTLPGSDDIDPLVRMAVGHYRQALLPHLASGGRQTGKAPDRQRVPQAAG